MSMTQTERHLVHTLFYLLATVLSAFLIARSEIVHTFLQSTNDFAQVGSLVAGMFFTTVLTTAPAMVVLGQLALDTPLWVVALFGGFGAVVGDYILFLLVRDGMSRDVEYLLKHSGLRRLRKLFDTKLFHRLLPFLGALVLASPLPDELGLAMLGLSDINKDRFLLISFVMNASGIVLIGLVARAVVG